MGYIKLLNERVAALEAKQTEAESNKLRADLAAEREKRDLAQRELAALRQAIEEGRHVEHFHTDPVRTISQRQLEWDHYSYWIHNRAAKLLAQDGVPAQPQSPNRAESPTYSDPTIEDATAIQQMLAKSLVGQFDDFSPENFATALKQAGFVRKVTPNE